jgi:membrane-bound ClpP family serine protease
LAVSHFFRPNLKRNGRIARGVIGTVCLIAGIITVDFVLWLGLILVVAGLFAIYEALRGWCLARACGIRTKI